MSYQVLARKWRPHTFAELVGQQHVVDAVTNALENNRLHHAYLFTGTRGVGKTTIARIFAKSLNCETGQSANPCGKCNTCTDINDGRYVDLLEIDAASRTKVEDTRELLDNVQYKPTRGDYKVYLIDEVHMLSKHSFNALLKTLEEPPPHVKFLLATTDPQKLPVTILSRCLQFNLKALSVEQIQGQLESILKHESIEYDLNALHHIAKAANGSMRDALSLTDQAIAQGNNKVTTTVVMTMLGLLDRNLVLKLAKAICERDGNEAIEQLTQICQDSPDYSQVLVQLMATFHQISLTQIVPDVCKLDSNNPKAIYVLSKAISVEHAQMLYQIALNGKRDLPYSPDGFAGLQMTILRMLAFSPVKSIDINIEDFESNKSESHVVHSQLKTTNNHNEAMHDVAESIATESIVTENEGLSSLEPEEVLIEAPSTVADPITSEQYFASVTPQETTPAHEGNIDSSIVTLDSNRDSLDEMNAMLSIVNAPEDNDFEHSIAAASQGTGQENQVLHDSTALKQHSVSNESAKDTLEETMEKMALFDELNVSDDKEGAELPVKKSEVVTADEVEAPKPPKEFGKTVDTLSSHLDTGEKLVQAAQVDDWSRFVDELGVRALARQLLLHSEVISFEDSLEIKISEADQHLNVESNVRTVEEALQQKFCKPIPLVVSFHDVNETPYEIQTDINDMRLDHAKEVVNTNEAIQELIKAFNAKVIPGSIEPR